MKDILRGIALRQIAALVGSAPPTAEVQITGVASLVEAEANDLSFLNTEAFLPEFSRTKAAAVLVQKKIQLPDPSPATVVLRVDDADLSMSKVLELFAPAPLTPRPGTDPLAKVDPSAEIASEVSIGAFSIIAPGARIGQGTVIHPLVFIGQNVEIGPGCQIYPNVTIRERVTIGARVIIHAGSVLGTDGFGYRWDGTKQAKVPQIGTVIVEDDVEIGSCVCIDRAKFSATRIGRGTKIDNLVQVAHNVSIGPHSIIVGQAGLAGSAVLGTRVILGGQTAVRDHVHIGDGAMVAACAAVAADVPAKEIVSGMPALPHRQSLRENAAMRRLPDLVTHVRKLEESLKHMEEQLRQLRGSAPEQPTPEPRQQ